MDEVNGIVIKEDELYITLGHRVVVFNKEGHFLRQWRLQGPGRGYFTSPHGIAVSPQGVYVTESHKHCIQVFQPDGSFSGKWGRKGAGDGAFHTPNAIAVDSQSNIYVTEKYGAKDACCRIQKFTPTGDFMTAWEIPNTACLDHPVDMAIDPLDNLYVLVSFQGVYKFSVSGKLLGHWTHQDISFSIGIAASNGTIYITTPSDAAGFGGLILKFSSSGEFLEKAKWMRLLSEVLSEIKEPAGIAVSKDEKIFILKNHGNKIQRCVAFKEEYELEGFFQLNLEFECSVPRDSTPTPPRVERFWKAYNAG